MSADAAFVDVSLAEVEAVFWAKTFNAVHTTSFQKALCA